MRKMTRTVWIEDPDSDDGERVRLLKGDPAPRWYRGRHAEDPDRALLEQDDEGGEHPAGGQEDEGGWTVPRGSATRVLAAVGSDPDRAARALAVERAELNRPQVVEALERLAGEAPEGDQTGQGDAQGDQGGQSDADATEAQREQQQAVEAFLDRNADDVIADVGNLSDEERQMVAASEAAGRGRVTVLRALGVEPPEGDQGTGGQ